MTLLNQKYTSLFLIALWLSLAHGEPFRLARGYGPDMVLQMAPKVANIWGKGEPGAQVNLTFDQVEVTTVVGDDSRWEMRVPPQRAGGPHLLQFEHSVSGGETTKVELDGVLFGDVWLCLGEGNMEFFTGTLDNFEDEVEIAESYENLRLFHVGRGESESLQTEIGTNIEQQWTRLNNVSLEWFSAECAIFGEKMVDARPNRPVGIVLFAWTNTPLQSWLSPKVRAECQTPKPNEPHYASGVHNAIIWPLRFFTFRGVLWDHGESVSELNNMDSSTFVCATAALVADWRSYFYQAYVPADVNGVAFPVGIVQLGPDSSEPLLENISPVRLFQSVLLDAEGFPSRALSDVFTAATYDLVDNGTAHRDWFTKQFKAKRVVAERLIASAKKLLYESEESNKLKFQIVESDFAALKVEFSSDFTVSGTAGFAYLESLDGDWTPASIISQTNREVRIEPMPPNATVLAYAPYTTQCLHLKCSIYDLEGFPLQPQVVTFVRAAASRSAAHLAVLLTTVLSVAVLK